MKDSSAKITIRWGWILGLAMGVGIPSGSSMVKADIAFEYAPITKPILSASFTVDFAAMNAHRYLGSYEMNSAYLIDLGRVELNRPRLADYSLSEALFGTAALPASPVVNMGSTNTGLVSTSISSSFFPALSLGRVGLRAQFTDTVDGRFAIDCITLTITTTAGITYNHYYGGPLGNENNGFGLAIPDNGDLPGPLPGSLPIGATGTGFDETIGSISILAVPEPAGLLLLSVGVMLSWRRTTSNRRKGNQQVL